jgi:alkaline phosphatase
VDGQGYDPKLARKDFEYVLKKTTDSAASETAMASGHPLYDNDGQLRPEKDFKFVGNEDIWKSLIEGTVGNDSNGDGNPDPWILIQDQAKFQNCMTGPTERRLIGIPKVGATLQQDRSGDEFGKPYSVPFRENVPTLEEMTMAAINILDDNPDGFFLMVEGGAVD